MVQRAARSITASSPRSVPNASRLPSGLNASADTAPRPGPQTGSTRSPVTTNGSTNGVSPYEYGGGGR